MSDTRRKERHKPPPTRFLLLALGAALAVLVLPAPALALEQPLSVETETAYAISRESALVEGVVEGKREGVDYNLAYAPAASPWCTFEGRRGGPEVTETPPAPLTSEEVQAELGGLTPGSEYCVELVARRGISVARGAQVSFTAGAPSVGFEAPEPTSPTTALLAAEVHLAGQASQYRVLYGAGESEWCVSEGMLGAPEQAGEWTAPSAGEISGEFIEAAIAGLSPGSEYCAALALKNETAEALGPPQSFTSGAPSVFAFDAHAITPTSELVEGFLAPAGQSTSYRLEYAQADSEWCTSEGASGSRMQTAPLTAQPSSSSPQLIELEVGELQEGQSYCAEILAENESATTSSFPPLTFTAGAPSLEALETVPTSPEDATVYATVELAGAPASYELTYAPAGSPTCEGTTEGSDARTQMHTLEGAGSVQAQIPLTELQPGSEYCVQMLVSATGMPDQQAHEEALEDETFFVAGAPTARTLENVKTSSTSALVKGEIEAAEQPTTYLLAYGPADSRWCESEGTVGNPQYETEPLSLAQGPGFVPVQLELKGLEASTEYCAAFIAENESGESPPSSPAYFKTRPKPVPPKASTAPVKSTGQSSATLEGEVDPGGEETTYQADYGLGSSAWCESEATQGSPEHTSAALVLGQEEAGARPVRIELEGLSPGTEYCAQIVAHNTAGEATVSKPVRFKTAPGSTEPTKKGGGEVLGTTEEGSGEKPAEDPEVGETAVAGTVFGSVTVERPGASKFITLGSGALIPDGSEIEATDGRVRLTVELPNGTTQTAEVFGGRFKLDQEKSGFTKFVLTLKLSGCPRTKLPKGASAASIIRSQPLKRHLWVTEKGGHWGTSGRYVSTSVEGTTWLTTDECGRSTVHVSQGRVKVRNLLTKKTKVITAGHSYTATAAKKSKKHHRRKRRKRG